MKRSAVAFALLVVAATLGLAPRPAGAVSGPVVGPAHTVASTQAERTGQFPNGIGSAFDGTNSFLVWTDSRGGSRTPDIYGARVAPDGTVLDPSGIAIATGAGIQTQPSVTYAGDHFVVVWEDRGVLPNRIEAARVSRQGIVLDSPPLVLGEGVGPAVASGGSTALVVWAAAGIRATRIASDGTVLDPGGFTVASDSTGANAFSAPSVASNGTDFLVGYDTGTDGLRLVAVTTVSAGGAVGASVGVAANARESSIASNGSDYLVAYAACRNDCEFAADIDIDTRLVAADLSLSPRTVAATGPAAQDHPDVAFNAGRFLVAYRRQALEDMARVGPIDVRSSLLDAQGVEVVAQGVIIDQGVYGSNTVTAGPGDDFGIGYEDLPASASPLLLRSASPK